MPKTLSEMSNAELWQLFPIFLEEHNPQWKEWFDTEYAALHDVLFSIPQYRLSHIGSTAIANIKAKPIIDMLLEVPKISDMDNVKCIIMRCGYMCMHEEDDKIDFCKGYTESGFSERVFHLHVRASYDNDELYFRDYMNNMPDLASEYEALKLSLAKQYKHDRDRYTMEKGDFITKCTKLAKSAYPGRYACNSK